MTTTVGIIGLGQVGASIGLALKAKRAVDRVLGSTRDSDDGRAASAMQAIDASVGLKELVRDSDVLFLCVPLAEMRPVLEKIRPWLKERAVLVDTAPSRSLVNEWVQELLPPDAIHIGLVPAPNPSLLVTTEWGTKAASPEFFHRSTIMIVSSPRSNGPVEELALNVVRTPGC